MTFGDLLNKIGSEVKKDLQKNVEEATEGMIKDAADKVLKAALAICAFGAAVQYVYLGAYPLLLLVALPVVGALIAIQQKALDKMSIQYGLAAGGAAMGFLTNYNIVDGLVCALLYWGVAYGAMSYVKLPFQAK